MIRNELNRHEIGLRVRRARLRAGLNQAELAEKLGLAGQSALSMIERGARAPSNQILIRLCNVLRVDPGWLLHGRNPPPWVVPEAVAEDRLSYLTERRERELLFGKFHRAEPKVRDLIRFLLAFQHDIPPDLLDEVAERLAAAVEGDAEED